MSNDSTPPKSKKTEIVAWVLWRRSDLISHYKILSEVEITILELAMKGETFSVMCEKLLDFFSEQETPMKAISYLQSWIQEEMLSGLKY